MNNPLQSVITRTPAIQVKNQHGKTYQPDNIRVSIVVFVGNRKRFSLSQTLENKKNQLLEEAAQYIPIKYKILTAEIKPALKPDLKKPIIQIRYDCIIKE